MWGRVAAGLCVVLASHGCVESDVCTLAGCGALAQLDLGNVLYGSELDGATAQFCIREQWRDQAPIDGDLITATITRSDGSVLIDKQWTASYWQLQVNHEPDGDGCGPVCDFADLTELP